MLTLGTLGFTTPLILTALAALPILWWLLRAVPPAPVLRRFPGIALLLGLREKDPESQRTPWWLLLLRVGAVAALILALAGPVLNPRTVAPGDGPLLVLMDASWASARDWPRRTERVSQALSEARRTGRPVAVVSLTEPPADGPVFRSADYWQDRLGALSPAPYAPSAELPGWLGDLPQGVETLWLSDGLARDGRQTLLQDLQARGPVNVFEPEGPVLALMPAGFEGGAVTLTARRAGRDLPAAEMTIQAMGRDPTGTERALARGPVSFTAGATSAEAAMVLPPELRNRITRFQIEGARGAGAVSLTDDSLQRRKVALLNVRDATEALALLSPLHFIRQALEPTADLIDGTSLDDLLLAAPDVIVLADHPGLSEDESLALQGWVDEGGLLLRFAGPRLASAEGAPTTGALSGLGGDPLLPVQLRAGGRTVGGAMSWGAPRNLASFREGTPFAGLPVPDDVEVRAQVLAQPGPELAQRSIAELSDGTPLVTRRALGDGQVVLFHVTANADWSNLPLSGLFVSMLERLAVSTRGAMPEPAELVGTNWQIEQRMDGFGLLHRAADRPSVSGEALADALTGADGTNAELLPGLYSAREQRVALNATTPQTRLQPADWPATVPIETGLARPEMPLAGYLLSLAALALMIDVLATLALGGRLVRVAAVLGALALFPVPPAQADDASLDPRILQATESVVLAHVTTGEARIDEIAQAGLKGLSDALYRRTSVEPAAPMAVNPETDELAVFPFLYWPVLETSPIPSPEAYVRLNRYLRSGGLILFDTRDAEVARLTTGTTPAARRLQAIAAGLDVPPLEPVPSDHVLTRTFYLLGDFPGRHAGSTVWVEAAPPDAVRAEGMPFRNLNDGVTPVVIGANDWAAAWAVDASGMPMLPVGRGATGERQREMSLRFGINLVMHVLSGNYKSDQVHVPALLERLGQ